MPVIELKIVLALFILAALLMLPWFKWAVLDDKIHQYPYGIVVIMAGVTIWAFEIYMVIMLTDFLLS